MEFSFFFSFLFSFFLRRAFFFFFSFFSSFFPRLSFFLPLSWISCVNRGLPYFFFSLLCFPFFFFSVRKEMAGRGLPFSFVHGFVTHPGPKSQLSSLMEFF